MAFRAFFEGRSTCSSMARDLLIGVSIILTPLLITVENPLISVEKGVEKYLHGQIEYAGFKVGCARAGRHMNMGTFEGKSTQAEQL